ncbi:hypothetical protein PoB_007450400 [Plakobranchus ocellatus]|uniref:Ig-like domain-containing protein n=1 Tax=Plakobranchus ocellatus TaxID=259542 RepID=A0AAV4DVF0_9GAST|nr:hypothetical protein PoB_007450400 [Plakobranchus ocellatus]
MGIAVSPILFGATFGHPTQYIDEAEQQLADLASKVDTIDTKLDVLSDTVNTKLDILIEAEGRQTVNPAAIGPPPAAVPTTSAEPITPNTPPVAILSVERVTVTPDENSYTVRFTMNGDQEDLYTRVIDQKKPVREVDSIEVEGDGIKVATFTSKRSSPFLLFYIGDDKSHLLCLEFNNSQSGPEYQDVFNVPVLNVDPPESAVYEPGQDVLITISVPFERTQDYYDLPSVSETLVGVDLSTNKYHTHFNSTYYETGPREEQSDTMVQTFNILTASHNVSGYFSLVKVEDNSGGTLVKTIVVNRYVEIYPSSQTGYLPSGYLSFLEMDYQEKAENGNDLVRCRKDKDCILNCYAVGEQISQLMVARVLPDGEMEPVHENISTLSMFTYLMASWTYRFTNESEDSDGIVTFECLAIDSTNNNIVSKRVEAVDTIPSSIDQELSDFQIEDDPTNPGKKRVTLNCAVTGRPMPDVRFSNGSSLELLLADGPPDFITPISPNKIIATKVMTFDASDLNPVDLGIAALQDQNPSCSIFGYFSFDSHTFEIRNVTIV